MLLDIHKASPPHISPENLLGVDVKRIVNFVSASHLLPASLCKLIISVVFLYKLLRWQSVLAGIGVLVIQHSDTAEPLLVEAHDHSTERAHASAGSEDRRSQRSSSRYSSNHICCVGTTMAEQNQKYTRKRAQEATVLLHTKDRACRDVDFGPNYDLSCGIDGTHTPHWTAFTVRGLYWRRNTFLGRRFVGHYPQIGHADGGSCGKRREDHPLPQG